MNKVEKAIKAKILRKARVRSVIKGTKDRPRLSVSISNIHISAQIIDDEKGVSLAAATSVGKKLTGTMTDKAKVIGTEIANNAKKAKISKVVFDRNGRVYHGRIKALAEAARAGGLEF